MANEARVYAEGVYNCVVRQFTVADGTAIVKGALMQRNNVSRGAIAHVAGALTIPLGFAVQSKAASDGFTEIGLQRTGVVSAINDGAVATGDLVYSSKTTANRVEGLYPVSFSRYEDLTRCLGRSLETKADAAATKIALTLG